MRVSQLGLPRFLGSKWPSVTNSNAGGLVASVTTERSVNDPIGSAPVLRNSVPTIAGSAEASSVRSPKFFMPCMLPAQVVLARTAIPPALQETILADEAVPIDKHGPRSASR